MIVLEPEELYCGTCRQKAESNIKNDSEKGETAAVETVTSRCCGALLYEDAELATCWRWWA